MGYSVTEISDIVFNAIEGRTEIVAALLMGSCARHEETYFTNQNGVRELLSDYEMLLITKDGYSTSECDRTLRELADKLKMASSSPCFELEWSFKTKAQIRRLDKRFIFFEAKDSAYLIYGEQNAIELFPDITISNLNFSELNTVINHRLYHVLRDSLKGDEHFQKYLIARNTLDIPTAVLPLVGVLKSSYSARNQAFFEAVDMREFPAGLKERLNDCLEMKKNYDSEVYERRSLPEMQSCFLQDMKALYAFQSKSQGGKAFRKNRRLFLSAIYQRSRQIARQYFNWENLNQSLYSDMIQILENGQYNENDMNRITNRMFELYGYK